MNDLTQLLSNPEDWITRAISERTAELSELRAERDLLVAVMDAKERLLDVTLEFVEAVGRGRAQSVIDERRDSMFAAVEAYYHAEKAMDQFQKQKAGLAEKV